MEKLDGKATPEPGRSALGPPVRVTQRVKRQRGEGERERETAVPLSLFSPSHHFADVDAVVFVVIAWKKSCPDSFVVVVVVIVGVFFSSNAKSSFVRFSFADSGPFTVDGLEFPSNAVLNFGA